VLNVVIVALSCLAALHYSLPAALDPFLYFAGSGFFSFTVCKFFVCSQSSPSFLLRGLFYPPLRFAGQLFVLPFHVSDLRLMALKISFLPAGPAVSLLKDRKRSRW
jgi:hypothetical protein